MKKPYIMTFDLLTRLLPKRYEDNKQMESEYRFFMLWPQARIWKYINSADIMYPLNNSQHPYWKKHETT